MIASDISVRRILQAGLDPRTRTNYDRRQLEYTQFMRSIGAQPWPATDLSLQRWAASLTQRALKPQTISTYITAVRSHNVDANEGVQDGQSANMKRFMAGLKRMDRRKTSVSASHDVLSRVAAKPERLPVDASVLTRWAPLLVATPSHPDRAVVRAALFAIVGGMLRTGEVVPDEWTARDPLSIIRICDAAATATSFIIRLRTSKIDKVGSGATLSIRWPPAVRELSAYLHARLRSSPSPSAALFVSSSGHPLSRVCLEKEVERLRALTGMQLGGGWSGRRGGATCLFTNGHSVDTICGAGQWSTKGQSWCAYVASTTLPHLSAVQR